MKSFKDFLVHILGEEKEGHHASVIPLTGFSPIPMIGHSIDLGGALKKLPGDHHLGISSKADLYSPDERSEILHRQWQQPGLSIHHVKSGGETIANAFHALPDDGKPRHLHMLIGADRKDFAEGFKKSLEAGKVKEMGDNHWDSISIHHPEDLERSHGMSGTRMRTAAAEGDIDEFHRHLGSMFSRKEAETHMNRIKTAIENKTLKVKR